MSVRLVPVALEHAPALQPLLEHPGVAEMTPLPHPYPPDGAREYVAGLLAGWAAGTRRDYVILGEDDRPVGVVLIKEIDAERRAGELGYWLGVPYWGRGYATAAATAAIALAFGELGLERLTANCLLTNAASLRVLEKLGFVREREDPWELPKWAEPRMGVILALAREDWHG